MMKKYRKQKGLLSIELVVTISVLAVVIGVLIALGGSFGKLNNQLWAQHTCYNAAQAQIDAIAQTGKPIDPAVFERLWPGVTCTIETSNGSAQWQGLQRVDLTLTKKVKAKDVQVQVTRCFAPSDRGGGQ